MPAVYLCSDELAGVVGFEPTIHGTKNRCLTTWLHPNGEALSTIVVWGVQALSRKNMNAVRKKFAKICNRWKRSFELLFRAGHFAVYQENVGGAGCLFQVDVVGTILR